MANRGRASVRIAGAALLAVVVALCQQSATAQWNAPWRPSYTPFSSGYTVNNGTLFITLLYNKWQGYFNNTWTLPTGSLPSITASAESGWCMDGGLETRACFTHVQAQGSQTSTPTGHGPWAGI